MDFLAGVPDLASFPGSDWLWAQREAFRQAPTHAMGYGDPAGAAQLRTVLASYSAESAQPTWTRAKCWCAADLPRASA